MIILVIGGSASGKSEYAERRMMEFENRIYFATMRPYGRESERTVLRHQLLRKGKGFLTVECGRDLTQIEIGAQQAILLEDLPNLVANELYRDSEWDAEEAVSDDGDLWIDESVLEAQPDETVQGLTPEERIQADLMHLMQAEHLVIVTGDVFADGVEYDTDTETYRMLLGRINQWTARHADEVWEVVHGIPVRRK